MSATQLPLGIHLRDSSVFASFYAGRNQPVIDALLALRAQTPPRVVWLHGMQAVGKTHLLQAICARATQRGERAAFIPLSEFRASGPEMLAGLGALSWVCIDDVELVLGEALWERRLFALHQELEEQGGRLVFASTQAPQTLGIQLPDLASRLRGGLVLRLQVLDDAEQTAALKLRAEARGLELNDEVAQYLLRRLPRDMTALCEFLDKLDRAALVAQRRLTIPFVKQVMGEGASHSDAAGSGRDTRK
ncbi:MAG: DnaA regulatory inactivator Hda [Steroidobacteraceae bacterium]